MRWSGASREGRGPAGFDQVPGEGRQEEHLGGGGTGRVQGTLTGMEERLSELAGAAAARVGGRAAAGARPSVPCRMADASLSARSLPRSLCSRRFPCRMPAASARLVRHPVPPGSLSTPSTAGDGLLIPTFI